MKQYIDKAAIVAEMERRIKQFVNENNTLLKNSDNAKELRSRIIMCKEILSFIDTLEAKEADEEPVSNDIEAEFVLYLKHEFNIPQEGNKLKTNGWRPSPYDILDIAKHFAKWQKEQMITKACEWLREHKEHPFIGCEDPCLSGYLTDEFIEEFKKAMEE